MINKDIGSKKPEKPNTILVIGNGFDLACKLKSRYSDFIDHYNQKNDHTFIRKNIWYILLHYGFRTNIDFFRNINVSNENNWMNIEYFIKEILQNKIKSIEDFFYNFSTRPLYIGPFSFPKNNSDSFLYDINYYVQSYLKKANYNIYEGLDVESLLFRELKEMEKDFSSYLTEEIKIKNKYITNANSLIAKIENKINEVLNSSLFIVSFNYTNPFSKDVVDSDSIMLVHGNLEQNNIIIGIDCNDVKSESNNDKLFRFSKAWRKINNHEKMINIPPKNDINDIVFFGHSLGEQDYSYFYSLFNYYDIYNNNIKLIFIFSDYGSSEEENLKNEQDYYDKIFALLRHYVTDSLGIKEANSFITKIQLENRLLIERISTNDLE